MESLNLGILAHVDAGKTTLTERLLYEAGAIEELGHVDDGTTQTDSLALERQRGITIRSAVASFAVGDVTVNLIDTPGHPDFIAEVERTLGVLDGVVLIVSAVEGVQPQTRILMRALQRLRLPTVLFVNKIDRRGADAERVLEASARRLSPDIIQMGSVRDAGTPKASFHPFTTSEETYRQAVAERLGEYDEPLLQRYLSDPRRVSQQELDDALAAQVRAAALYPVFCGSALTGSGVEALVRGAVHLLPLTAGRADQPVSGTVFKIERGERAEKIALVRLFAGSVHVRDRIAFGDDRAKVTKIKVFEDGGPQQQAAFVAGQIAEVFGLAEARVGDIVGRAGADASARQFPPPTLESVVEAERPSDGSRLRAALRQLAEQDPLINVREEHGSSTVSLYGEVQKEVIEAMLATDFDVRATFRPTTTICVERPARAGSALKSLTDPSHPYSATIGLRIEPGKVGSGVAFRLGDLDPRSVPVFVYKTVGSFSDSMQQYVLDGLRHGLYGWKVTDCAVTMTDSGYYASDGPTKPVGETHRTTAADFRKLTPLVLELALKEAGIVVCEPMVHARIETPAAGAGPVLAVLARVGRVLAPPTTEGDLTVIGASLPAARVQEVQRQLPSLTGGEGLIESEFAGYEPVGGSPPRRPSGDIGTGADRLSPGAGGHV